MHNIRKFICLIVMYLSVGFPIACFAESAADTELQYRLNRTNVDLAELGRQWRIYQRALQGQKDDEASEALRRLRRTMAEGGVERFDAAAQSLIRQAEQLRRDGRLKSAMEILTIAESLAPSLSEVRSARARLLIASSPASVHDWGLAYLKAYFGTFALEKPRLEFLLTFILWAVALFLVCVLIFWATQVIRYALHFSYDLSGVLPFVSGWVSAVVCIAMLSAMTIWLANIVPALGALLVLLSLYQSRKERVVSILSLLTLAVVTVAGPWLSHVRNSGFEAARWLEQVNVNPADRASQRELARLLGQAQAPYARLILARSYKRAGRLEEARVELSRLGNQTGLSKTLKAHRYNLLGNLEFIAGRVNAAEAHYKDALRVGGEIPQVLFNLHRLEARRGNAAKSEEYARRASEQAGADVAKWTEVQALGHNEYIVDSNPSLSGALREIIYSPAPMHDSLFDIGDRLDLVLVLIVSALLILIFGAARSRMRLSYPCQKCLKPATLRASQSDFADAVCDVCTSLFVLSKPVDRKTRFAKEVAVRRVARLRVVFSRVFGFLLPGIVQLLAGRLLSGWLFVGAVVALLGIFLLPYGVVPMGTATMVLYAPPFGLVLFVLGLLCVVSGLQCIRWTREVRRVP